MNTDPALGALSEMIAHAVSTAVGAGSERLARIEANLEVVSQNQVRHENGIEKYRSEMRELERRLHTIELRRTVHKDRNENVVRMLNLAPLGISLATSMFFGFQWMMG